MKYTSVLRRRARQLRRLALASTRAQMWRDGVVVRATWWDGHPNFGDDITPWILPNYGIAPIHRVAGRARLAGVGSILEFLPQEFDGAIWGSGLMYGERHPLPRAHVLAVRGHRTAELIGAPDGIALGDPGILVARHCDRPDVRWDVGLVPHGHHRQHAAFLSLARAAGNRVRVVNVHGPAARVVREIGACDAIVTTSLHGLVTADAFGIPALWTTLDPPLSGGAFKFHDYESVISPDASRFIPFDARMTLDELVARAAAVPRSTVTRVGDELEASLARLPSVLGALPRFPHGALAAFTGRD